MSKKLLVLWIPLTFLLSILLVSLQYVQRGYTLPRRAWMFWDTADLPPLIKIIKENTARKLRGWQITYLNKTTIDSYIRPSTYPRNFEALGPQHKADWIRLKLLNRYGGVWIDAGIIINDPNALDRLYEKSVATKSQFTGFSFKNREPNSFSTKGLPLYIENWFIMAPLHSIIIPLWLARYEKAIDMGFGPHKQLLKREGVDTNKIFNTEEPEDTYLTQHACLQYVLQKQLARTPSMLIMPAEDDMLKIRYDCDFREACTMETIRDHPERARSLPYIKLVKGDRDTGIDITSYFE